MKEKPILFSTPMVRAILEGRKTMTRRIFKNVMKNISGYRNHVAELLDDSREPLSEKEFYEVYSPYFKDDILWVRETFTKVPNGDYIYRADPVFDGCGKGDISWNWTSPLFLPREAARIFLEVKAVRVERVQALTGEDAIAEGFENRLTIIDGLARELMEKADNNHAKAAFIRLWNNLDKNHTGYDWEDNPYVYVYEFMRVK
jgi:hypothetical protein